MLVAKKLAFLDGENAFFNIKKVLSPDCGGLHAVFQGLRNSCVLRRKINVFPHVSKLPARLEFFI